MARMLRNSWNPFNAWELLVPLGMLCLIPSIALGDAAVPTSKPPPPPVARPDAPPTPDALRMCGALDGPTPIRPVSQSELDEAQAHLDATPPDAPERAEALHRRANLYERMARVQLQRRLERERQAAEAEAGGDAQRAEALRAEQAEAARREAQWSTAATKDFASISNHPRWSRYARMDEVLFSLALRLVMLGREDLARPIFKRLIKDHPMSRSIPDTYFVFGAYYFDRKEYDNALKFFDRVLRFPEARIEPCARRYIGKARALLGDVGAIDKQLN